jgi:hypothetical protein
MIKVVGWPPKAKREEFEDRVSYKGNFRGKPFILNIYRDNGEADFDKIEPHSPARELDKGEKELLKKHFLRLEAQREV